MKFYDIDSVFTFGKYEGMTIAEVYQKDPKYLKYCEENIDEFYVTKSTTSSAGTKRKKPSTNHVWSATSTGSTTTSKTTRRLTSLRTNSTRTSSTTSSATASMRALMEI